MHNLTKEVEYLHRMTTESGAFAQDKITSGVQLVVLVILSNGERASVLKNTLTGVLGKSLKKSKWRRYS